ncbi:proline dehydrogenase 1, mitochondrial isoform 2-T2 [Anableps anableps]
MFCVKTVPGPTWANAEIHLKWLLSHRRLRRSVSSGSTTPPEKAGHSRSRSRAQRASARLHSPGMCRGAGRDRTNFSSAANKISIDFEQSQEAYRSKDSLELLRSLVVFKLCSYDFLVDNNKEIIDLGKKILGQKVFDQLMKMTFYGQFVAGKDHISIQPLVQKNQAFGVGSVLDYSVEEDISQKEANQKESSSISAAGNRSIGEGYREKNYEAGKQLGDSQREVIGTYTYFYADEAKCDQHMETFMKCIKASGGSSMDGFSAIKMTALGRPQLLLHFSEVLMKWHRFFTFLVSQQDDIEALEQRLELTQLQELMTRLGANGDYHSWFSGKKGVSAGRIDILDWNTLIDDRARISDLLFVPNVKLGKLEPLLQNFTVEDENQLKRTLQRLDVLAKCASENGVHLMVDAEQTYFQPAISKLTLDTQRIYNREKPVVFNTYQCYLKEAYNNVTMDIELSKREDWCFAAKLVRGAYMYQERQRAKEFRYEDPINPNYDATSTMYHSPNYDHVDGACVLC